MDLSDNEVDFRFWPIVRDYWQYDSRMPNFDLALLDDRVTRAAAHILGQEVDEPPFDHEDVIAMITSEYLLSKEDATKVFQTVEDRLYKKAN